MNIKDSFDSQEEEKRFVSELGQLQATLDIERAALGQARAEIARAEGETARLAERLAQAERDVLAMRAHRNPVTESEAQTDLLGEWQLLVHEIELGTFLS
jgi:chromosome segregation ATPase